MFSILNNSNKQSNAKKKALQKLSWGKKEHGISVLYSGRVTGKYEITIKHHSTAKVVPG